MSHEKRCKHCARELSRHERYAGDVCSAPACRRSALNAELTAFRRHALRALGESPSESIPIAVVPHRAGHIVPLDPNRRLAFEQHLRDVAQRAEAADENPQADSRGGAAPAGRDAAQPIAAAVCSACGGFCCYPGGANAAFIGVQTLQRYALEHGVADAKDIVATYLAYVPERHFEGSCVYHGAEGCSLPRRMRSATCNGYACQGLKDALAVAGDDRRLVVTRHDNRIVRGILVDGERFREVVDGSAREADSPRGPCV